MGLQAVVAAAQPRTHVGQGRTSVRSRGDGAGVHDDQLFTYHERMETVNTWALESAVAEQLRTLGFELSETPVHSDQGADLHVIWPQSGERFMVDVTVRVPRAASPTMRRAQSRRPGERWIVGLPHVTRGVGADLRDLGVQYVDSGGNAWITGTGLTLWIEGRKPALDARPGIERPSRAFRPAGLRVLFVILSEPELRNAPQREIAAAAGVSLGVVSNTLTELRGTGVLGESRGARIVADAARLEETWIEHYIATLRPALEERRVDGPAPGWWMTDEARERVRRAGMQLGGESALVHLGAGLRAEETMLYGAPPWQSLVRELRMPSSPQGRVVLRERFWDPQRLGGGEIVPPLLVRADAIASRDARQVEAALELTERCHGLKRQL